MLKKTPSEAECSELSTDDLPPMRPRSCASIGSFQHLRGGSNYDLQSTNGTEEQSTNGTEEQSTNGTEEQSTNGTEEQSTNGTEEQSKLVVYQQAISSETEQDDVLVHLEDPADKASDEPIEIPDIVLSQLDLETSEVLGNEITKEEEIFSEEPGADPFKPVTQVLDLPLSTDPGLGSLSESESEPGVEEEEEVDGDDSGDIYPETWYFDQKHVFIFSEAGKPIYSRYGKEENIVGLFGVMQVLLSCVADDNDEMNCIRTEDHLFVFRCHSPLILVAVSHVEDSEDILSRQLQYVAHQAVYFLTQSRMQRLFKNRHNFDLRRQLTGVPKFFDSILDFVETDDSFLLTSVKCAPLPSQLRTDVTSILLVNRVPQLVFAVLLYGDQLVTLVRPKQYTLAPQDIHLLMNYVKAGNFRDHGEKWAPACLPYFNSGGYLYVHDSYISETSNICLILITNEQEEHITMIDCKQKICEALSTQGLIEKLEIAIKIPFLAKEPRLPHLRHFLYKSSSSQQLVSPDYAPPYHTKEEKLRLHHIYCSVYNKMHCGSQQLSIYYLISEKETVVGYVTNNSELYCTFSPHITKPVALNFIDKLLRWIKREENRFFILGSGVY